MTNYNHVQDLENPFELPEISYGVALYNLQFLRPCTHTDELQIRDNDSDGTVQKLGFFGATPTVQRSGAVQAKLADNVTLPQAVALINELREALVEKGLIKGSA